MWGSVEGIPWARLPSIGGMQYYRVHIYDVVFWLGGPKEVLGGAPSTDGLYDADKGAMKAEGQARLELPRNPGYASVVSCMCDTGCRVHVG